MTGAHRSRHRFVPAFLAALVCLVIAATTGTAWQSALRGFHGYPPALRAQHMARSPQTREVVVVMGASVAAGYRASPGASWPELLAQRLRHTGSPLRIVNASISATRLLTPNDAGQPSMLSRETSAVLNVPSVRTVILTDLINDIQQTPHQYNAQAITAGITAFARAAHARHVRVLVATIPPYGGFVRYEPSGDACRQAVNSFLRHSSLIDGVLDFDAALADPNDPRRLRPADDSGDHLHPDDAGHAALAKAVSLSTLTGTRTDAEGEHHR